MDPPAFHIDDYLEDLSVPSPIEESIMAAATASEPLQEAIIAEPRSSGPTPSKPIQDTPKAAEPEPMQAEGSDELVQVEVGMLKPTSGLTAPEPTHVEPPHVEVQKVEVIEPMDIEPTAFGSLAEKPGAKE